MRNKAIVICLFSFSAGVFASEKVIMAGTEGMAFRSDGETLCIATGQGDTLFFQNLNDVEFAEDLIRYELVDHLPEQGCLVIHAAGYEWMEWILVMGESGAQVSAISPPNVSPNGERLLCMMDDITAGFIENGIQVWRVVDSRLVLEFEDIDVPWGPVNPSWEGDEAIVFEKTWYTDDWELASRPGRLFLTEGGWMPDEPSDWAW